MSRYAKVNGIKIIEDSFGVEIIFTKDFKTKFRNTTITFEDVGIPGISGPNIEFNCDSLINEVNQRMVDNTTQHSSK